jgi:hypothetical protein
MINEEESFFVYLDGLSDGIDLWTNAYNEHINSGKKFAYPKGIEKLFKIESKISKLKVEMILHATELG